MKITTEKIIVNGREKRGWSVVDNGRNKKLIYRGCIIAFNRNANSGRTTLLYPFDSKGISVVKQFLIDCGETINKSATKEQLMRSYSMTANL